NPNFRRLFRRALGARTRDHFERTDARRPADRQRVIAGVAGDLVQTADHRALRVSRGGRRGEKGKRYGENTDHGDDASNELVWLPLGAKLDSTLRKSSAPCVYGISPPGGSASMPAGSIVTDAPPSKPVTMRALDSSRICTFLSMLSVRRAMYVSGSSATSRTTP